MSNPHKIEKENKSAVGYVPPARLPYPVVSDRGGGSAHHPPDADPTWADPPPPDAETPGMQTADP